MNFTGVCASQLADLRQNSTPGTFQLLPASPFYRRIADAKIKKYFIISNFHVKILFLPLYFTSDFEMIKICEPAKQTSVKAA